MKNKNKILYSLLLLALVSLFGYPVLAQQNINTNQNRARVNVTPLVSPNVTPFKEQIRENKEQMLMQREEVKNQMMLNKEENQAQRQQMSQTVTNNMQNMFNLRVNNAKSRLEKRAQLLQSILNNVDTRFSEIEKKGVDLSTSRGYLSEANTLLQKAMEQISALTVTTFETREELKNSLDQSKQEVQAIYQTLKEVSAQLKMALSSAKEVVKPTPSEVNVTPESFGFPNTSN